MMRKSNVIQIDNIDIGHVDRCLNGWRAQVRTSRGQLFIFESHKRTDAVRAAIDAYVEAERGMARIDKTDLMIQIEAHPCGAFDVLHIAHVKMRLFPTNQEPCIMTFDTRMARRIGMQLIEAADAADKNRDMENLLR